MEPSEKKPALEWTGERFLPWVDNAALRLEHLHRYGLAQGLARGRRVLDVGCGEGYGSALLAAIARLTIGIDVDPATVAHAQSTHARDGLHFLTASASRMPFTAGAAFDLAVAFEVIEHVPDPEALLAEAARVLAPDGLLLLSTPNPEAEQHRSAGPNPFHFKEFAAPELEQMLRRQFDHVALRGQRVVVGSSVFALGSDTAAAAPAALVLDDTGPSLRIEPGGEREAVYTLALASRAPLPEMLGDSLLVERGDSLTRERLALEAHVRRLEELLARKEQHAAELTEYCQKLEELLRQKDAALEGAARHCRALEAELAKGLIVRLRERLAHALGRRG